MATKSCGFSDTERDRFYYIDSARKRKRDLALVNILMAALYAAPTKERRLCLPSRMASYPSSASTQHLSSTREMSPVVHDSHKYLQIRHEYMMVLYLV